MAGNIDKLDPLFFRRRIPADKKTLVKRLDNLVKRVFFILAVMAARVRVLRFERGFVRV